MYRVHGIIYFISIRILVYATVIFYVLFHNIDDISVTLFHHVFFHFSEKCTRYHNCFFVVSRFLLFLQVFYINISFRMFMVVMIFVNRFCSVIYEQLFCSICPTTFQKKLGDVNSHFSQFHVYCCHYNLLIFFYHFR